MSLVAAELFVRGTWLPELRAEKNYINTTLGPGNCYSTPPDAPVLYNLGERIDRSIIESALTWPEISALTATPYCLLYHREERWRGLDPSRKRTVSFLGDSFTFGEGVGFPDTLAARFAKRFPGVNVRNLGSLGANIEAVFVHQLTPELHRESPPDAMVYFYNMNDVLLGEDRKKQERLVYDFQNVRIDWVTFDEQNQIYSYYPPGWATLSWSALYRAAVKAFVLRTESRLTQEEYLRNYDPEVNAAGLLATEELFGAMAYRSKERQVPLAVVIYPLLHKDLFGDYPFRACHDRVLEMCRDAGIELCLDGLHAFDDSRSLSAFRVHPVDYHPNGKANERLIDWISTQGELLDLLLRSESAGSPGDPTFVSREHR